MADPDSAVKGTNDDAVSCKLSCVKLGYYSDVFVGLFANSQRSQRRPPLINRGYWSRVSVIAQLRSQFLLSTASEVHRQLVILGSGFDTVPFLLASVPNLTIYEIDFPSIVKKKSEAIASHEQLRTLYNENIDQALAVVPGEFHSARHHIMAGDLRAFSEVGSKLEKFGFDSR